MTDKTVRKFKISDIAKDFSMTSKEIISLVKGITGEEKKSGASIVGEEFALLFDALTLSHSVKSFKEYFATGEAARKEAAKKRQDEKDKKLADQLAILEQLKAAAEAEKKAKEKAKEPKAEEKTVAKTETKPKAEKVKAEPKTKTAEEKPAKTEKPEKDKKAEVKPKKAEKKVEKEVYTGPLVAPPKKEKRESVAPNRGPAKLMHVDTRTSNVNIDKYNEKYENIAPANTMRDNFYKKQKIKQKSQDYRRPQGSKRETEADKLRRMQLERIKKTPITVTVGEETTVGELAAALKKTAADVIKELMKLGMMATVNQVIDYDTAEIVVTEMGAKIQKLVTVSIEEKIMDIEEDTAENLKPRDPVVVVMGHVDHGKTSLLDAIRNTAVTDTEAGGITQHIGAYRVKCQGQNITFLDTPGHAAFTAMRQRGAMATDIAILVVAADDGIMPQTIEAINHAKAAKVQIIVAINKMDKPDANPDRIMQQLTEHELVPEEWGGDVICVKVSAKTHEGIDELLQNVLLVAEMQELKANPNRKAKGVVIEARLDKGKGPVATLLVQNGTLNFGDIIVAGTTVGRIRMMTDENGKQVKSAGPSVPVEITGLTETPSAGDGFDAVSDERLARELVEQRKEKIKNDLFNQKQKVTLDNLFENLNEGELKELAIIVKADVQGSVEAVKDSLVKLSNDEVKVNVIHGGVGAINESDVMLAGTSGAIIVGFNVRPDAVAKATAEKDGVDIRTYRVIYDCIEEIEAAMKGMLAPKYRENIIGNVEVRNTYKISSVGTIAGCYVTSGKVTRTCQIRVVRDGIVVAEDNIASLRRFKDNVKEVEKGFECGIGLEKFADIKEGDQFEAFVMEEYRE
ncbi:MAG: translation initiation factor IF-2 [Clostridia bacterium]|nr:translation initiation factor IF-2 [Clostridia bacterium]